MKKKILIIEDDIQIGSLEEEVLNNNGYQCFRAYSGSEAVLLLEKESIDLIILDLMLPGLLGEEVLKKSGDIPVIVVSAKTDIDDKVKMLKNGAQDYMTKPFSARELTEIMGGTIDSEINEGVLSIILMLKISSFYRNDLFLC